MGTHDVTATEGESLRVFTQAVLEDLRALGRMLEDGLVESGVHRIGAEQELFLVDAAGRPAPVAIEVLERLRDPRFCPELARFNLEANLTPRTFAGRCLSELEREVVALVAAAREAARASGAEVVLTGVLPTVRGSDLTLGAISPGPRYAALNEATVRARGGEIHLRVHGIDEVELRHDNVLLEACGTSFQVHLQVSPAEFPVAYNASQLALAPALAAAVNAPLFFGRRVWHETRIALFERAADLRHDGQQARGQRARASFGESWVRESVLELYREDLARFGVVLGRANVPPPFEALERGEAPALAALGLHNGTVWRWSRPCYGVVNGRAHLRIENRVFPSGPTTVDEVANAAVWLGLVVALPFEYGDVSALVPFDDAKANFAAAARDGLGATLRWPGVGDVPARELLLSHLVPLARSGLEHMRLDREDIARYLGLVEERVREGRTGAAWMLEAADALGAGRSEDERDRLVVAALHRRELRGEPVHRWAAPDADETDTPEHAPATVAELMTTDVVSVRPEDALALATSIMAWRNVRFLPVEDGEGRLVGVVSRRALLAHFETRCEGSTDAIADVMDRDPPIVPPDLSAAEALAKLLDDEYGCLLVARGDRLLGIVTEHDATRVACALLGRAEERRAGGSGERSDSLA